MARRIRLDELLCQRGLFDDVKMAHAWIMEGRVIVEEVREDKPGTMVRPDANIRVRGLDMPYASRGGMKLEAAIDGFSVDVSERIVIDAGASTGGFTDCLLKHGAAKVYSVDVGYGQLAGSLRQDPRVVNMERMNIGEVIVEMLDPRPDLGVMDLSYLSLSVGVPTVGNLLKASADGRGPEMVALVKPLFEVKGSGPDLIRSQYEQAIARAFKAGEDAGFCVSGVIASPILGSGGTLEFLVHYTTDSQGVDARAQVDEAIDAGLDLIEKVRG